MSVWFDKRIQKYRAQVYDPSTKRMREVKGGPWAKPKDAQRAELRALDSRTKDGHETVAHFAERWMTDFTRGREKPSTIKHNEERVRAFVKAYGKRRMDSITRDDAYDWCEVNPSQLPALRAMFNDAKRARPAIVQFNPFSDLGLDRSKGKRKLASDWLTLEQVEELASCAIDVHGPLYGPVLSGTIIFGAYVGLRIGEICELEWDCLRKDDIEVRWAKCPRTGARVLPKNGLPREAPYPRRAREAAERTRIYQDQRYVFVSPRGKQLTQQNLRALFNPVRARFGRPKMNFHELRHMYATFLWERLPEADVAVGLGHTDGGALVQSTYGHRSEIAAKARILQAFDGYETGELSALRQRKETA